MTTEGPRSDAAAGLAAWIRGLAALAVMAPALYLPGLCWYPHVAPKVFLVRAVALLMLPGLVALLALRDPRYRMRVTWPRAAVAAAVLSCAASTLVSIDPVRSVWDNTNRLMGLHFLAWFAVVVMAVSVAMRGWRDWRPVLRCHLAVAALVLALGVAERAGIVHGAQTFGDRASSTLGNPIYLAAYAVLTAFLAWWVLVREERRGWRILAGAVLVLCPLAIWASESRGPALALVAGAVVTALGHALAPGASPRVRRAVAGGILAAVLLAGGAWLSRDATWAQDVPLLRRVGSASVDSRAAQRRLHGWRIAIEAGTDRPLLGWGPRTYAHLHDARFPPIVYELDRNQVFADQAHNAAAHVFAEQGGLGLAAYLLLLAAPVIVLARRGRDGMDTRLAPAGLGLVTAYFVHGLFAFDDPSTLLLYGLFLALVDSAADPDGAPEAVTAAVPRRAWIAGCIAAAVSLHGAWFHLVVPVRANHAAGKAISAAAAHRPETLFLHGQASQRQGPYTAGFALDFGIAVGNAADPMRRTGRADEARLWVAAAREGLAAGMERDPLAIRPVLLDAFLHHLELRFEWTRTGAQEVVRRLEDAHRRAPTRPDVLVALGNHRLLAGDVEGAIEASGRAFELAPNSAAPAWRHADALLRAGRRDEAEKVVLAALNRGVVFEGEADRFVRALIAR